MLENIKVNKTTPIFEEDCVVDTYDPSLGIDVELEVDVEEEVSVEVLLESLPVAVAVG